LREQPIVRSWSAFAMFRRGQVAGHRLMKGAWSSMCGFSAVQRLGLWARRAPRAVVRYVDLGKRVGISEQSA
jgi:hypothetical protein